MKKEINVKQKIEEIHGSDAQQLNVIFSNAERVIVEAPAGCGKTTTMVSRLAYLYSIKSVPNPKKILGLTFSVNAALKIKRDIGRKLPDLFVQEKAPAVITSAVNVTNYHGFCKGILKKYGRLVSPFLGKDINLFRAVGEEEIKKIPEIISLLSEDELSLLYNVNMTINSGNMPDNNQVDDYIKIIEQKLFPKDFITHNCILLITLRLFEKNLEIKKFYQEYYSIVVIDEFQDTNIVSWNLIKNIIGPKTKLLFLGDPLQRIYGFIGALPNVMECAKYEYNMTVIPLSRNYRFQNNEDMLNLDYNIRENAKTQFRPVVNEMALVPAFWAATQEKEVHQIVGKIIEIKMNLVNEKVAILSRSRGHNIEILENELKKENIDYFYGMFTDDDEQYIDFHVMCQKIFIKEFGNRKTITNISLEKFSTKIKDKYKENDEKIIKSLIELLDAFIKKIEMDYNELLPKDKYTFVLDVFENRQLKQSMEYIDSDVILSTIHGSKGLEWDYVFVMDIERWIFPGYPICNDCAFKWDVGPCCGPPENVNFNMIDNLLDELSVFYVAVTRAKKQVYLSASASRYNRYKQKKHSVFSCFANLKGIKLIDASK
ncbi:UvrD-helicase domain-containing protein [uncultured Megasphaera sp.]|uniref:UvrD-helicase domain-containing protein n=1 Tax=uncultured Megasphaera sp. TaxID=165188 RepID=UPI0025FB1798|nr:ATP-dependent helicase [uncultured Megasphaera sp.]